MEARTADNSTPAWVQFQFDPGYCNFDSFGNVRVYSLRDSYKILRVNWQHRGIFDPCNLVTVAQQGKSTPPCHSF